MAIGEHRRYHRNGAILQYITIVRGQLVVEYGGAQYHSQH